MVGILSLQNADCDKDQTEIPQALFNSLTMTATAQCDPGPGGGGSPLSAVTVTPGHIMLTFKAQQKEDKIYDEKQRF